MNLQGRKIDDWGNVIFNGYGLIDRILSGEDINNCLCDNDDENIQKYNEWCEYFDLSDQYIDMYSKPSISIEEFDRTNRNDWFLPDEYKNLDVLQWLVNKCKTDEELERVYIEWEMFEQRDMSNVLRFLIYLIDHFRKNNIVWGVGRGSSVASYCLYLIGVHKVNSLKFDLDPKEFLK